MSKLCPIRDDLFFRWNAVSTALSQLEGMKIRAIKNGDLDFAQWDTRIREVREEEELARRGYERHVGIHGCND